MPSLVTDPNVVEFEECSDVTEAAVASTSSASVPQLVEGRHRAESNGGDGAALTALHASVMLRRVAEVFGRNRPSSTPNSQAHRGIEVAPECWHPQLCASLSLSIHSQISGFACNAGNQELPNSTPLRFP